MKEALKVLAELVAEGVIEDYAIGGAMGATADICASHGLVCPVEESAK